MTRTNLEIVLNEGLELVGVRIERIFETRWLVVEAGNSTAIRARCKSNWLLRFDDSETQQSRNLRIKHYTRTSILKIGNYSLCQISRENNSSSRFARNSWNNRLKNRTLPNLFFVNYLHGALQFVQWGHLVNRDIWNADIFSTVGFRYHGN